MFPFWRSVQIKEVPSIDSLVVPVCADDDEPVSQSRHCRRVITQNVTCRYSAEFFEVHKVPIGEIPVVLIAEHFRMDRPDNRSKASESNLPPF